MEQIMCDLGYRNIGLPCVVCSNKMLGFVITLLSMIKVCFKLRSGDILIIQYPLKKYYNLDSRFRLFPTEKIDSPSRN